MFKLIVTMSLPAMFSILVQALYNVVDSMFVSWISTGDAEITALTVAFPLQMLLASFAVGTGIGINSLVSRRLGEQKFDKADSAATHGLLLAVVHWALFAVIGLFFSHPFAALFTNNPDIAKMGGDYLQIVMIGSFGAFIEINIEKTLQATGNMIFPMLFQLTGAIANIILDPIFIFVFDMGVAGAAVATIIGQILSMVFALIVLFAKEHAVHVSLKGFRLSFKTLRDIYAVAIPSIVMQSISSVLNMGLNSILKEFSDTATAVLGVYYKLQSFVFMPVFGLTHGVLPIMGYNFGAGNKKRLMSSLKIGVAIAAVIMLVGMILFWAIPGPLLQIFNASPEMMRIGIQALRSISLCFIPAALGILFSSLFQATGMGVRSLIISILRQLVVILPTAYLLSRIDLMYIWYAFPIAECVSMLASILFFWDIYRKQLRYLQPHESGKSKSAAID